MEKPQYTNALIHESSPYLLDHAHNPVHWYPWGKEALQKAKKENKPLIISIGYASCHWCHVMENESYADPEVAHFMNDHFISIKVDREERPDIDQIYMDTSILLTGSGGWPLNAFALPDGKPFHTVTYLPKNRWLDLLEHIVELYEDRKDDIINQAEKLTNRIASQSLISKSDDKNKKELKAMYHGLFPKIEHIIDFKRGGFTRSPKFPLPPAWEWMLQYAYITKDEKALKAVKSTLTNMAFGGINDQIGGGFARYSTDAEWIVPHFEKMLFDNAQLVSLYAHAYQVTGDPLYANVIHDTLQFIERELMDKNGGFHSSINADSEGVEGKFYLWKMKDLKELFDEETMEKITDYYSLKSYGNWEDGNNVLYRTESNKAFAERHKITPEEWEITLDKVKKTLLKQRETRIRPTTDNKILTSWNAMMLKGYIDAYRAIGEEKHLKTAVKNAIFLRENMLQENGAIWRNYMNGKASIPGMLEDYAQLAEALIELYQVTFDKAWLDTASEIVKYALAHFGDAESSLLYFTADNAEVLVARKKEIEDSVIASSNSVMAHVLYKLGTLTDNSEYLNRAEDMLAHVLKMIPDSVPYFANWARLMGNIWHGIYEVAVMGEDADKLNLELQKNYLPLSFFLGGKEENLPLLEHKLIAGDTTIYVCRNKVCKQPVHTVEEALQQMES